jgi:hypothetical protein
MEELLVGFYLERITRGAEEDLEFSMGFIRMWMKKRKHSRKFIQKSNLHKLDSKVVYPSKLDFLHWSLRDCLEMMFKKIFFFNIRKESLT